MYSNFAYTSQFCVQLFLFGISNEVVIFRQRKDHAGKGSKSLKLGWTWKGMLQHCKTMRNIPAIWLEHFIGPSHFGHRKNAFFSWLTQSLSNYFSMLFKFHSTSLFHPSSSVSSLFIHVRSSSFSLVQLTLPSLAAGQEQSPLMARLCEVNGHFCQKGGMKTWLDMVQHFRCTRQMQIYIHQVHTTCSTGPAWFCEHIIFNSVKHCNEASFDPFLWEVFVNQSSRLINEKRCVSMYLKVRDRW